MLVQQQLDSIKEALENEVSIFDIRTAEVEGFLERHCAYDHETKFYSEVDIQEAFDEVDQGIIEVQKEMMSKVFEAALWMSEAHWSFI